MAYTREAVSDEDLVLAKQFVVDYLKELDVRRLSGCPIRLPAC